MLECRLLGNTKETKKYAQHAWFVSGDTPMLTHISGVPITQHYANNAVHQIKVTAFNGLIQISFKFWSSAAPAGHLIPPPKRLMLAVSL
jgi:hypothetical protein